MSSSRRPLLLAALGLFLLLGFGLDASRKFSIDTSMEHFLPEAGERKLYRISRDLLDSTLTSRMVLTLGLRNDELNRDERREVLLRASRSFGAALEKLEGIKAVTQGPPPGVEESFFDLYFPRRFAYFSLEPEREAKLRFGTENLRHGAERLKETLASPQGVLVRNLAPRDPWMLFFDFVTQAGNSAHRLDVLEGQFFAHQSEVGQPSSHEDFAVFFVELDDSALDSSAQAPLLAGLNTVFESQNRAHDSQLILEASGANRFAVATERSMKEDIERVFSLSALGIFLLFFVFFRSPGRMLFLVLPIISGLVCALWATLTFFGSVHALTLAFGGALIGVALDYPVHTLCHHDLKAEGCRGGVTVRRLLPTLGLAAGTTILGLLGLGWAAFPGIREIAIFSAVGVSAALITTALAFGCLPPTHTEPSASRRVSALLLRGFTSLGKTRTIPATLVLCSLFLAVAGFSRVRFAPGLESLAPLDPKLLAEEERVQERVGQADGGTLAISLGSDLEQALERNEEAARVLSQAKRDGLIGRFENVSTLLRSQGLQKRSQRAIQSSPRLAERTLDALGEAGFVKEGFSQIAGELARPLVPLTKQELEASPLAPLVEPFLFEVDGEVAVIAPLGDVQDFPELERRFATVPGVHLFSQKALLNAAYSDLRGRTTELLLLGLFFVFAAALARYRNLTKAAALLLPAVLAASCTVGILSLLGVELNLLHLLGLLLVCSMGVDYGVFLLDSEDDPRAALLSIMIGCLSTMLSFGALALSSAPALRALGVTISVGILLSLLLAPTALLLLPAQRKKATL